MTMLKQHLFRYQGHIGAYLVVAGVDPTGVGLFTVHAHGSTDKLPYVTMGSGSLAAMSVFETQWKSKMTEEEAVTLASNAIQAGIFNDLGSGSNVDVAIITKVSLKDCLKHHETFCENHINVTRTKPH
jgi:20S proteasome subunit beta 2